MKPYKIRAGMKARYKLTVRDKDENILRESAWSDNVLTDHFFATLGANSGTVRFRSAVVGTGNDPALPTDTTLANFLASEDVRISSTVENQISVSPRFIKRVVVSRFNAGFVGGSPANITEAGMIIQNDLAPAPSDSSLLGSRVLIVDSIGNPVAVPVSTDEILDVTWEWTTYVPEDEVVTGVPLDNKGNPETRATTVRAVNMNSNSSTGAGREINTQLNSSSASFAAAPSLGGTDRRSVQESSAPLPYGNITSGGFGTHEWIGYNSGALTVSFKMSFVISDGNYPSGVGSFITPIVCGGQWQFMFDQQIPKTADDLLEIDWDLVFERL